MTPDLNTFGANLARFTTIVQRAGDPQTQTPCTDWTATDLVDHVVDTERDLLTQHGAVLVDRPVGDLQQVWAAHQASIAPYVADENFLSTAYDGYFGPTTVGATLANFYGFDLIVHGWDLAKSWGIDDEWSEAEMSQVETSMAGFGPALYSEGVCKPAIEVPAEAPHQTRLLAQMGRRRDA